MSVQWSDREMAILTEAAAREDLYASMWALGAIRDRLDKEHRQLSPPYGTVAAGGAHMDSFFRSEAISALLTGLRKGKSLKDGIADGAEAYMFAVRKWNERREYQVHRDATAGESYTRQVARLCGLS